MRSDREKFSDASSWACLMSEHARAWGMHAVPVKLTRPRRSSINNGVLRDHLQHPPKENTRNKQKLFIRLERTT